MKKNNFRLWILRVVTLSPITVIPMLMILLYIDPSPLSVVMSGFLTDNKGVLISVGFVAFFSAFISGMIRYVNKDIDKKVGGWDVESNHIEIEKLKNELQYVKKACEGGMKGVELNNEERASIILAAKKRIIGNTLLAASDSLKNDISNFNKKLDLNNHYTDIVYRLETEISRLNRRGGVNFTFGITMALAGMVFLAYVIYSSPQVSDKMGFMINLIPKFSFVLLIELFAYFFLRLYKNGFEEVKYFQNEITNIEAKVLAIKFLNDIKNEDLIKEVIIKLMSTERNFILEKGQTTVALERDRIKSSEDKKITDILAELLRLKSK